VKFPVTSNPRCSGNYRNGSAFVSREQYQNPQRPANEIARHPVNFLPILGPHALPPESSLSRCWLATVN
jgi:hypothetical protein